MANFLILSAASQKSEKWQKKKIKKEKETKAENTMGEANNSVENTETQIQEEKEPSAEEPGKKKKSKKDKKDSVIQELSEKVSDISDKHLRLQAEFDNFRRRTMKEKMELIKSGGESILVNIIPIVDDFERALDSLKELSDEDAGKQGTMLIYNKFNEFLKQNNVKEIEALHQEFDVDHHEAITKIPASDKKLKGKVVDVIQKGYLLNEKVIRFAKVIIGE